jgi:glycosyltransferase involved in cell wall biosynthesis
MAKIEPNRQWEISADSYNYNCKIFKGIHPTIGGFFAHFNPGLLFRLLKNDYDIAVVGGMASPTHWLAPFFISRKKFKIMSVESNLFSVTRKNGFGAWIISVLLNTADAYQVTGQPQIDYIHYFQPKAANKSYIHLPNLIDDDVFTKQVDELRKDVDNLRSKFGVSPEEQMWVLPARLIEIKGIIPFVKALVGLKDYRLFILGEGEQTNQIKSIVDKNNLPVTLVGFVQQNEVIRYYAAADLFVLPSFRDPSPLSPIEASAAGLPLFVSKNIGNINEVLGDQNGWSFEPGNADEINIKAKEILGMSRSELKMKGEASRQQYYEVFETEKCIRNYAKQILEAIRK